MQASRFRLLRRATLLLNSAYLSELHRSRNGPMSLSGGNLPLGRRDIEGFPFPACLALPAAQMSHDAIEHCICSPRAPLPDEQGSLLALLDGAFDALSANRNDAWDHLAQRVILELVGCSMEAGAAILEAWGTRMGPKAVNSSGPPSGFRGNARGGGNPTRAGCTEPRSSACSD